MSFTHPAQPVPARLETEDFVLRPITAADAELDHAAVMETRQALRLWEQSTWPADDFTVEQNRADLADLERRHAEHRAFTYTVLDHAGAECLGCVYLFPTTATFLARSTVTPLGQDRWEEVDAVTYFWVRESRMQSGLDARLLAAIRTWLEDEWGFERAVYVTSELFEHQVELLERTDLTVRFQLLEPGKPARYLVFG